MSRSSRDNLVNEIAMANVEVKGGDGMVGPTRKAQVPLDVEANGLGVVRGGEEVERR